jgi:glutamyl-tRNA synthetase
MSKRDEGAALGDYPKQGFLPAAVVNFLTLLGWAPKDESEIFNVAALIEKFSLASVNRAPARFDPEKCRWVNQQHLLGLSPEEFVAVAQSEASPAMLLSIQEKISLLSEIPEAVAFYLNPEFPIDPSALEKVKSNDLAAPLLTKLAGDFASLDDWSQAKDQLGSTAKAAGAKPGQLMFPLRIALSGKTGGPDLGAILEILGKDESIRRLHHLTTLLA